RLAFFFQAEDGIRDFHVTGVQTCALPIFPPRLPHAPRPPRRLPLLRAVHRRQGDAARAEDDQGPLQAALLLAQPLRSRHPGGPRSEERRVGKESRRRWDTELEIKKRRKKQ